MFTITRLLINIRVVIDSFLLVLIFLITQVYLQGRNIYLSDVLIFLAETGCWFFAARSLKLYQDFRIKPFSVEWVIFLKALGLFTLLFSSIFYVFFHQEFFPRKHFLVQLTAIFFFLPVARLFIRISFKKFSSSKTISRKVLIVGAGTTGINFYEQYVKNEYYGYKLTGFLDDEKQPSLNGHYLGKTSDLDRIIDKYDFDDIVVTLPATKEAQIGNVISTGEKQGKRIRIIPNYQCFADNKLQVDSIGSLSIITLRSLPLDILDNKVYKRIFDIVFSFFIITFLLSWLIPVVGMIIKLTSKGPVFFKQVRWGLNNKTIVCYKFRTMVANCKNVDDRGNYLQASKNDIRITKVGNFLRKTNLDELPQFLNVLLGSMSVVGPRPHPVPLNLESKNHVENYMMRHWIKPGITGWAQVHGYRGETKVPFLMKKRVEHDIWYIENWSFWIDLQIILQTVVNMVKGDQNAY